MADFVIYLSLFFASANCFASSASYYATLGIPTTANEDVIKRAFRKLAMKYHPDRHSGLSKAEIDKVAEKFKAARKAYEILMNPYIRNLYDSSEQTSSSQNFTATDRRSSQQILADTFNDTFYFDLQSEEIVDRYTDLRFSRSEDGRWLTKDSRYEFLNIPDRGLIRDVQSKLVFIPGISRQNYWKLDNPNGWFPAFLWDSTLERNKASIGNSCNLLLP